MTPTREAQQVKDGVISSVMKKKLKIPCVSSNPIEFAFWEGWHAASESHCRRYFWQKHDNWHTAWMKSMVKKQSEGNL
jgi:hypothetical protein